MKQYTRIIAPPITALITSLSLGVLCAALTSSPSFAQAPHPAPAQSADVQKLDPHHFVIQPGFYKRLMANPLSHIQEIRTRQSSKGLKVYAIRPGSLAAQLGLQNGDTLQTINATPIPPLKATSRQMKTFIQSLSHPKATNFSLQMIRNGEPLSLQYAISDTPRTNKLLR